MKKVEKLKRLEGRKARGQEVLNNCDNKKKPIILRGKKHAMWGTKLTLTNSVMRQGIQFKGQASSGFTHLLVNTMMEERSKPNSKSKQIER